LVGAATSQLVDGTTGVYLGAAVGALWQEAGKTLKARQNRAKESAAITTAWTSYSTELGPEEISAWAEPTIARLQLIGSTYQAALASLDTPSPRRSLESCPKQSRVTPNLISLGW
jgi:hypothetical protein